MMKNSLFHPAFLTSAAITFTTWANTAQAVDVVKANNATALNLAGAWNGGSGPVPGPNDVAVWDNTVTSFASWSIGDNLDFKGIRIADPTGVLMTIGNTSGRTLTLGSSGIDMSTATADLTINAALNINATQTWSIASGRVLTLGSALNTGGSGQTLSLTGAGSINLAQSGANFGSTSLDLSGGIRLISVGGSRTIANAIQLSGDAGIGTTATALTTILQGNIDIGSATRTLSLQSSSTDATTSALTINGAAQSITGSGTLRLINGNASGTIRSIIGGGSSNVAISSDFEIGQNVVVNMAQSNAFTLTSDITVNGRWRLGNLSSASNTTQSVKSLSGGVGGAIDSGVGAGTNTSVLTIDGGASTSTTTFSGVIENGAFGRVAVTKSGNTTQIFAGSNSYTGQTQITAGTLLLTGTHTEASAVTGNGYNNAATGHFQVSSGATFGGSGRIAGNNSQINSNMILVGSGGVLAPGNGIGRLTLDGANIAGTGSRVLNMATGADFNLDLAGNGSSADQVAFWNYAGGDLLLNSNEINLTLNGALVAGTYTVSIFAFYSDSGTTLMSSGITSGLTLGVVGAGITSASINYNAGGNTIDLTYTVIPEPSTIALMGLGLTFVLWRRPKRAASLV